MADENPPNIVPFGKHKGKTIQEIQIAEPGYLDWLEGQPWFRDKFIVLHQTIINRGAEPEETPDHNALQALFLDDAFCLKIVAAIGLNFEPEFQERRKSRLLYIRECMEKYKHKSDYFWTNNDRMSFDEGHKEITRLENSKFNPTVVARQFENLGIDVTFAVNYGGHFTIEIKPVVGDDYPAVLRQINALRPGYPSKKILFLERYTGIGVTEEQFKAIFKAADIAVVFRHEVE